MYNPTEIGFFYGRDNIWVKKTKFSKTGACLFIFQALILCKKVSKEYLIEVLDIESRTTLYNYMKEIEAYFQDFDYYNDFKMILKYDSYNKEYRLILRKKR